MARAAQCSTGKGCQAPQESQRPLTTSAETWSPRVMRTPISPPTPTICAASVSVRRRPDSGVTTYDYGAVGNLVVVTTPRGVVTRATFSPTGQQLTVTGAADTAEAQTVTH